MAGAHAEEVCKGQYLLGRSRRSGSRTSGLGEQPEEEGSDTSCHWPITVPKPRLGVQSMGEREETAMKDCPHIWKLPQCKLVLSVSIFVVPQTFVFLWQISVSVNISVMANRAKASHTRVENVGEGFYNAHSRTYVLEHSGSVNHDWWRFCHTILVLGCRSSRFLHVWFLHLVPVCCWAKLTLLADQLYPTFSL